MAPFVLFGHHTTLCDPYTPNETDLCCLREPVENDQVLWLWNSVLARRRISEALCKCGPSYYSWVCVQIEIHVQLRNDVIWDHTGTYVKITIYVMGKKFFFPAVKPSGVVSRATVGSEVDMKRGSTKGKKQFLPLHTCFFLFFSTFHNGRVTAIIEGAHIRRRYMSIL
jgi:hypothetical protein